MKHKLIVTSLVFLAITTLFLMTSLTNYLLNLSNTFANIIGILIFLLNVVVVSFALPLLAQYVIHFLFDFYCKIDTLLSKKFR